MDLTSPFRVDDDQPTPGATRLVLLGRVTVGCAVELHRAAISLCQRGGDVTVDCGRAEYVDTAGMQLLFALRRELVRDGHSCKIVGASAAVREDIRLAGFAKWAE
jgi:anti-anti-sigma regulatory factor